MSPRTGVTSDLDIQRTANLLIMQHDDKAPIHADMLNKPFRKADLARKIRGALRKTAPVAAETTA